MSLLWSLFCCNTTCTYSSWFGLVSLCAQITVPLTADELPPLPQPEGALLIKNLKLVGVFALTGHMVPMYDKL